MNKAKYEELFAAFERAPMKEFLELLFDGVPPELKKRLIIEDVSYHRHSAAIVTLDAWMVIDSPDSEQWIWVRVEFDASHNSLEEPSSSDPAMQASMYRNNCTTRQPSAIPRYKARMTPRQLYGRQPSVPSSHRVS